MNASHHSTGRADHAPRPPLTKDQEVAAIERALDLLLKAALSARYPGLTDTSRFGLVSAGQLAAEFLQERDFTQAQRRTARLLNDPVGIALRLAVRTLGERLHEIGGLDLMQGVCERVAYMDEAAWGRRTDIMDKRWDGIGQDADHAGWCA